MDQCGFLPNYAWLSAERYTGRSDGSGTQYLIRSGKQGLDLLTRKVLTGHRYREVIESLSKSKFWNFPWFSGPDPSNARARRKMTRILASAIDQAISIRIWPSSTLTGYVRKLTQTGAPLAPGRSRAGYVGLDNRKVGRTAGWLLAKMIHAASPVAIFVGSHRYLCQEACEIGFRAYLREYAPHLHLLEPVATFESDRYAHEATLDLVKRHENVKGIYVAGGGIGGVLEAIKELRTDNPPVVIGHDLTEATSAGLVSGTLMAVLSHPLKEIAKKTVEILIKQSLPTIEAPSFVHEILPMQIFTPESI
jgi:DNA-binding LacI/PurR family transcriptional regulator